MPSEMLLAPFDATFEVPQAQKGSTLSGGTCTCCSTAVPSPALTFTADPSWSKQSSDIESFADVMDLAFDDEFPEDIASTITEGALPLAIVGEEGDDDAEDDEQVKRIGLAARRLALGCQEDGAEVSEAEWEAAADDDDEPEEPCMRIRLAARRLALGRQEDDDGEVSGVEIEAAAARMGMLACRYASAAGRNC